MPSIVTRSPRPRFAVTQAAPGHVSTDEPLIAVQVPLPVEYAAVLPIERRLQLPGPPAQGLREGQAVAVTVHEPVWCEIEE